MSAFYEIIFVHEKLLFWPFSKLIVFLYHSHGPQPPAATFAYESILSNTSNQLILYLLHLHLFDDVIFYKYWEVKNLKFNIWFEVSYDIKWFQIFLDRSCRRSNHVSFYQVQRQSPLNQLMIDSIFYDFKYKFKTTF
jgi:hypothetical protein